MGMIENCGLRKRGKRFFKITGGFSSFIAYITEEASFEEEEEDEEEEIEREDNVFIDSPAVISGDKLAGTGGDLAGKGR